MSTRFIRFTSHISKTHACKIMPIMQSVGFCNTMDGSEDHLIQFKEGRGKFDMTKFLPLKQWARKEVPDREDWSDDESSCEGGESDVGSEDDEIDSDDMPIILKVPLKKRSKAKPKVKAKRKLKAKPTVPRIPKKIRPRRQPDAKTPPPPPPPLRVPSKLRSKVLYFFVNYSKF